MSFHVTPQEAVVRQLERATGFRNPFAHWLLTDILPSHCLQRLSLLQAGNSRNEKPDGSRANSGHKIYFSPAFLRENPYLNQVVSIFGDELVTASMERLLGVSLRNSRLRISFCIDRDGFWLTPHVDLSVKLVTLIIYISQTNADEELGTDLFDTSGNLVTRVQSKKNTALLFRPCATSFHGFLPRRITGERRTLVINYVGNDWIETAQLSEVKHLEKIKIG